MHVENMVIVDCVINLIRAKNSNAKTIKKSPCQNCILIKKGKMKNEKRTNFLLKTNIHKHKHTNNEYKKKTRIRRNEL
jgi:hypothetical protein